MDTSTTLYMKRALITGINGFVGSYLLKELTAHGYTVFGIGRERKQVLNYFQVDVTDEVGVKNVITEINPTHIFHLAGIGVPALAEKNPELAISVSVEGTRHVLAAATELDHTPKILVTGSAQVYGKPKYLPINEKHPLDATGVYARARLGQEEVVALYHSKLPIILTRSFNHTGPGQSDEFVIPKIIKHIAEIKKNVRTELELGNINIRRDISYVGDVVRDYRLLLEQDDFTGIVNVCRGESISLKEVVHYGSIMAQLRELPIKINPKFIRAHDALDLYGDTQLLRTLILWEPRVGYQEMLEDMYRYWYSIV